MMMGQVIEQVEEEDGSKDINLSGSQKYAKSLQGSDKSDGFNHDFNENKNDITCFLDLLNNSNGSSGSDKEEPRPST